MHVTNGSTPVISEREERRERRRERRERRRKREERGGKWRDKVKRCQKRLREVDSTLVN